MKPLLWLGLLVLLISYPLERAHAQGSPFTGMGEGDGSIVTDFDVGARTVGPPPAGTVRGAAIGEDDDIIAGRRSRTPQRANVRRPRTGAPDVTSAPARPPARAARTKRKKVDKAADTDVMPVKPATSAAGDAQTGETTRATKFRWGKAESAPTDSAPRFHWGKRGEPIE